jgi:hypothetical protein
MRDDECSRSPWKRVAAGVDFQRLLENLRPGREGGPHADQQGDPGKDSESPRPKENGVRPKRWFCQKAAAQCLVLVATLAADWCAPVAAANREININTLRDKICGGWVAHMAGASWGAPTEFRYQGALIPAADVPVWSPGLVNDGYGNDDLYAQMPFLSAMVENGVNCDWTRFGDYFRSFTAGLAHANMIGRQNLQAGWQVPDSGHYSRNPHCDDIDWQIESNFAGIVAPGQPNAAAELAWRAGHTMNYGDGVYGGVFIAVMHAEAYFATNVEQIIEAGHQAIPVGSKYRQVIEDVLTWKSQGRTWEQSWQLLQNKWGSTDRCPEGVNNPFNIDAKFNGAYVLLGLLHGGADFDLSTRIAMRCGQDSDCNPGSVGAILGTLYGRSGLPSQFQSGLDPTRSFYGTSYTINDVTALSETMARQLLALTGGVTSGNGSNETWTIPSTPVTPLILEQWPSTTNTPPALTAALIAQSNLVVTLTASASDSDGVREYQWFFGDMQFTNSPTLTHSYLQPGTYSVLCYVADNIGNTSWRVLTVNASAPDSTPPTLIAMVATGSNEVLACFSEAVEPASAISRSNYVLKPGVTISGLTLGPDSKTVVLTTSPLASGQIYTGLVSGVRDLAAPPNVVPSNSQATFTLLPAAVWHSYDVITSFGIPQGRVADEDGLVSADLEFYESVNNAGVASAGRCSTFNPGPHPEGFNAVENYWANTSGQAYPYVGKSMAGRSGSEGNAPLPLGVKDLQCHPPENDHLVVAAFVIPMDGAYCLNELSVRRLVPSGRVRYRVFNQNKTLLTSLEAAESSAWVKNASTYWLGWLTAGDRIYFAADRDGSFVCDATEIAWTLKAWRTARDAGSLTCSRALIPASVSLTAEGPVDWAHWGLTTATSFNHKSGVTPPRISNYALVGAAAADRYQDNPNLYSWGDGTPTATNSGTPTGVYVGGVLSNGFRLTVPADTTVRTLKLYIGVWDAQGRLEVSLSDHSARTFTDTGLINTNGTSNAVNIIHFRAASAGQTLTVKWTIATLFNPTFGNVTLQAAAFGLASMQAWKASYFNPSELNDANLSSDAADPDDDGIPNLLEYALNDDPRVASTAGLPHPAISADHLTMTYTRRKAPTDMTYAVEGTSSVTGGWSSAGVTEQVLTDAGGIQTVNATDTAPCSANSMRFLRLKVSRE